MSTYDDRMLRSRLAGLAPEPLPGDWADVVRRLDAARADRRQPRRLAVHPRLGRRLLIALAVLVLVAAASASALAVRAFLIDRGFIGVPPVGASLSTPEHGKLVLSVYGNARGSRTALWLYADGRLIWRRENPRGAELPVSANRAFTGLLEQRLTTQGVDLLRSEALSSSLLDGRLVLSVQDQPCVNTVQVRRGRGLRRVTWYGSQCQGQPGIPPGIPTASAEQARALRSLVDRLAYPASWLPASAWKEQRIRAYLPARFELSYGAWRPHAKFSDALERLPASARALLRAKKVRQVRGLVGMAGKLVVADEYRLRVTTEEARALRAAFTNAGLQQDPRVDDVVLAYDIGLQHPAAGAVTITFMPILPHGEPAGPGG
jgi:hypothetical protein